MLPQGVAFATLAGLPPEYGLYSAIIPCAVAALAGSSRHVMSGPTNANSLALFAVLAPLAAAGSPAYIQLALAVTVLVGLMQWLVGALRLGSLAHFISPSALFGFTSGAAVLIAVHALKDALGLPAPDSHGAGSLLLKLASHAGQAQAGSIIVTLATLGAALLVRRLDKRKPYMLAGLAAGTMAAAAWNAWGGAGVPVLGAIAQPWPPFHVPSVDWRALPDLLSLAFALTIVALAQSISIAKAVAARSGQRIDANREFMGQGLSNIVGGFFSCYLSCGSLNRSVLQLRGRRQDAAGGGVLGLAAGGAGGSVGAAAGVDSACRHRGPAAVGGLDAAGYARWRRLLATQRGEAAIAAATLAATVTIRMEVAILLGTVLSLMAYLHRTSRPAMRIMGFDGRGLDRRFVVMAQPPQPRPCPNARSSSCCAWRARCISARPHVAQRLHELRAAPDAPRHLLVMAKSMNFIDLAGAEVWEDELAARRAMGGDLYFHRPRPEVMAMWRRTGFLQRLGEDHIFPDKATALHAIYARLDRAVCAGCQARIFWGVSRTARKRAAEEDARAGWGRAEAGAAKGRWRVRLEQG